MKTDKVTIKKINVYCCPDVVPEQDMLRYDRCFASDKYPHLVVFVVPFVRTEPTQERWKSFWQGLSHQGSVMTMGTHEWYTVQDGQRVMMCDLLNGHGIPYEFVFKTSGWDAEDVQALMKGDE